MSIPRHFVLSLSMNVEIRSESSQNSNRWVLQYRWGGACAFPRTRKPNSNRWVLQYCIKPFSLEDCYRAVTARSDEQYPEAMLAVESYAPGRVTQQTGRKKSIIQAQSSFFLSVLSYFFDFCVVLSSVLSCPCASFCVTNRTVTISG